MASGRSLLYLATPLFAVLLLVGMEERASSPSCETLDERSSDDLKVMMVADLLLRDPDEAAPSRLFFRDHYTARFFKKSFQKLKPDMLVVLGDISANGSYLTKSKWLRLLRHFQKLLGPISGFHLHMVLGDRDTGHCETMDLQSISWISKNFPGLDPSGCGAFEIANVSFVSLNSVAMLCEDNEARFNVETTIERESLDLQKETNARRDFKLLRKDFSRQREFLWRENPVTPGSGPVLLLHFPLYLNTSGNCRHMHAMGNSCEVQEAIWKWNHSGRDVDSGGPYELTYSLPMNVTEYVFQALRPRIVFSAHNHRFLDRLHVDGTREVTVPSMSWAARDDPGFVLAIFGQNESIMVSRCFLARESHILMIHFSILFLLLTTTLAMSWSSFA